jgi:hypothetical protein
VVNTYAGIIGYLRTAEEASPGIHYTNILCPRVRDTVRGRVHIGQGCKVSVDRGDKGHIVLGAECSRLFVRGHIVMASVFARGPAKPEANLEVKTLIQYNIHTMQEIVYTPETISRLDAYSIPLFHTLQIFKTFFRSLIMDYRKSFPTISYF